MERSNSSREILKMMHSFSCRGDAALHPEGWRLTSLLPVQSLSKSILWLFGENATQRTGENEISIFALHRGSKINRKLSFENFFVCFCLFKTDSIEFALELRMHVKFIAFNIVPCCYFIFISTLALYSGENGPWEYGTLYVLT